VRDLNRAIAFYCGVLGFDLMQRHGHVIPMEMASSCLGDRPKAEWPLTNDGHLDMAGAGYTRFIQ
jgi:catechol 2,3-dioxygenase-like lactoylglutathione lyase family enzyme